MRRTYSFDDFYDNTMREIMVDGERQLIRIRNRLSKELPRETRKVFRFIDSEAIGSTQNPFTDVNPVQWRPLNKKYVKRKGHSLFWEYKSKLSAWLFNTNPNMIFGSPRVNMSGILKVSNGSLIVSDLSNYDNISVGDKIYTSGIGNLIGDIYIGEVSNISLNSTNIEKIITVTPAVDFDNLKYIAVISYD